LAQQWWGKYAKLVGPLFFMLFTIIFIGYHTAVAGGGNLETTILLSLSALFLNNKTIGCYNYTFFML